jgi:hypothetical protein
MSDTPPGNEPPAYPGQQPGATPQPYQGQNPYTGQGQQYPPQAPQPGVPGGLKPKHPQATTVLVLGIVGFIFCQILGPFAWVMGNKTIKEIDANPNQWDGRSEALVGKILGIVSTVLLVLSVLTLIAVFGFILVVGATSEFSDSSWESETYSGILAAFF